MLALYSQIMKNNLKVLVRYKWDFMISFMIDPIVLIINIMLFTSIYRHNSTNSILGYSLTQMIWYFAAASFIFHFVWNFTDKNICDKVLSGDLIMDLLKPLSLFKIELFQAISLRIFGIVFEFVPSMIIYCLLCPPDFLTFLSFGKFLVLIVFAFLIYFLLNYIIGLSAFYFKNIQAIISIKYFVLFFSAGAYIPFEFFPQSVKNVLTFLPFQFIFYWPIQFFLNKTPLDTNFFLKYCLISFGWCVLLFISGHYLYKKVIKNFCAVG